MVIANSTAANRYPAASQKPARTSQMMFSSAFMPSGILPVRAEGPGRGPRATRRSPLYTSFWLCHLR